MALIMNIIGALCFIAGIVALTRKQWLYGAILVIVGAVIGGFGFII